MHRASWPAIPIVVLVVAVLAGCSLNAGRSSLSGTWRWTQSVGGFGGWTLEPASEGYSQRLHVGPGDRFAFFRNDSLMAQGRLSVDAHTDPPLIRYETGSTWWFFADGQYLTRKGRDTLMLRDRCADCYVHTFVRE